MMKGPPMFQSGQERAAPRDAAVESTCRTARLRVRSNALSIDEALPRSSWQRDALSFRISTTQNTPVAKKSLEKPVFQRILLECV